MVPTDIEEGAEYMILSAHNDVRRIEDPTRKVVTRLRHSLNRADR